MELPLAELLIGDFVRFLQVYLFDLVEFCIVKANEIKRLYSIFILINAYLHKFNN
jgi:hypothetical protein